MNDDRNGQCVRVSLSETETERCPPQGTAADIIKRAMVRMEPALRAEGLDARMLLQVPPCRVTACAGKGPRVVGSHVLLVD